MTINNSDHCELSVMTVNGLHKDAKNVSERKILLLIHIKIQ